MKIRVLVVALAGVTLIHFPVKSLADVIPTTEWIGVGGNVTYRGEPAPVGSVVDAYDPDGAHCGTWTVGVDDTTDPAGTYGFLNVYRDDFTTTTVDEGADPGDTISFKVNGRDAQASATVIWTANGATITVDLSATGIVAVSGVDLPTTQAGAPGDTVRFWVGVRNDGDGLDFYGITSTPDTSGNDAWTTVNQDSISYAGPGDTAYLYFDVIIAPFAPGDTVFHIGFEVFSLIDTTQRVVGSVDLIKSISDVGDDPFVQLPDGFRLNQNYPNPFNPRTTMSFALDARASVRFEVFDALGRMVAQKDLGHLPAGEHAFEFDAHDMASGVYFYRLQTDRGSQTRKMILVK